VVEEEKFMPNTRKLVFAEFSFRFAGQTDKRWCVAKDQSSVPSNYPGWGHSNAFRDIPFAMRELSFSEIKDLNLENLEHGIEVVSSGVSDRYIVLN